MRNLKQGEPSEYKYVNTCTTFKIDARTEESNKQREHKKLATLPC